MKVIAIQERCSGNASVGSMWLETKSFNAETPIADIVNWAEKVGGGEGKLIITVDRGEE